MLAEPMKGLLSGRAHVHKPVLFFDNQHRLIQGRAQLPTASL